MSRSQDRKCYYTRWSEPVLRRRYSMHLVPTSEEDTSSIRRSRSSSPLLTSLNPPIPPLDPPSGCCSCHMSRCNRKKSLESYSANGSKIRLLKQQKSNGIRGGSQQMRESLEIQLVGSQVEEALASDNEAALIQHLELATDLLESLIQHVRALQISHISASRVIHLAHQLTLPHSSAIINYTSSLSTDLSTRLRQAESHKENRLRLLYDVVENCSKNITVSKRLQSLMDDHRRKKEDFAVAARNFKTLLENSKLTVSQMDKLQRQYGAIMDDYKQNRRVLDSELPKIIKIALRSVFVVLQSYADCIHNSTDSSRLGAIRQGFCTIAAFYNDIEYSKQVSDLLKILGETLSQEKQATSDNHESYEKSQVSEICQKCKVNRVEKK